MTEPLTPEAALAASIHRVYRHGYHGGGWDQGDGDIARALLAECRERGFDLMTIDAVRSRETALREALVFIADWASDCAPEDTIFGFADIERMARAALAPPTEDAG